MAAPLADVAEDLYLPLFQEHFPTLKKIKNPYALFDYVTEDEQTYVELKARTNSYATYPTTMVGNNKVEAAKYTPDKTYYFAFAFTDGVYWIKYDPDLFKTFRVKQGGRYDRGRTEVSMYCWIPIERLTKLTDRVARPTPSASGPSQSPQSPNTIPAQTDMRP